MAEKQGRTTTGERQPAVGSESLTLPTVMVLGTYHMANRNLDYANVQVDDVLSDRRQSEIAECVERLTTFQPTKVAVEITEDRADQLNRDYQQYCDGDFALTADEVHQLGFRIAAGLNHERVYAINWMGGRFGLDRVIEFGRTHGQEALTDDVFGDVERETGEVSRRLAAISIREELCRINKVANLELDHRRYLTMARIGVGDEYVGAEWVAGWYERNLKIFVNLTRITTTPRDRISVIIGAGHVPTLSQLIRDSGTYLVEAVGAYLC